MSCSLCIDSGHGLSRTLPSYLSSFYLTGRGSLLEMRGKFSQDDPAFSRRRSFTLNDRKQNGTGFYLFEVTINIHMFDVIINASIGSL